MVPLYGVVVVNGPVWKFFMILLIESGRNRKGHLLGQPSLFPVFPLQCIHEENNYSPSFAFFPLLIFDFIIIYVLLLVVFL